MNANTLMMLLPFLMNGKKGFSLPTGFPDLSAFQAFSGDQNPMAALLKAMMTGGKGERPKKEPPDIAALFGRDVAETLRVFTSMKDQSSPV